MNPKFQVTPMVIINHENGIIQNLRVCKNMRDAGALTEEEYSSRKQIALTSEYVYPIAETKPQKSGLYGLTGAMFLLVNLLGLISTSIIAGLTEVNYEMTVWQILSYILSFAIAIAYFMKNDKFISVLWFAKALLEVVEIVFAFTSEPGIQTVVNVILNLCFTVSCILFGCAHLQNDKAKVRSLSKILLVVVLLHRFGLLMNTLGFFNNSFISDFMSILAMAFSVAVNFLPWLAALLLIVDNVREKKTVLTPDVVIPLAMVSNVIMEYKKLLDEGAITPEEFEAKRVSLLSKTNQ